MTFRRQLVFLAAMLAAFALCFTLAVKTHAIGYYWSPPNTRDGNGGITVLNCGFEVRGHVGPFCGTD